MPMRYLHAALLGFCLAGTSLASWGQLRIGQTVGVTGAVAATVKEASMGAQFYIDAINAKGGVLGKKLEVISRDDGSTPGDAVRVADELVTREGVSILAGTFLSHIGLAVTEFAGKKK
eukprot:gene38122-43184_t